MRMVVEVSEDLHTRVKQKAKAEGRPLSHVVRQMLENYVIGSWAEAKEYQETLEPVKPPSRAISKKDQAKGRTRK